MSFSDMATRAPITVKVETAEEIRAREDKAERDAIKAKISEEILAEGRAATWNDYGLSVTTGPDSEDVQRIGVSFDRTRLEKSYSWRYSPRTGPYAVTVGDYGDRRRFPPTKTGLSYAKIAAYIIERADAAYHRGLAEKTLAANQKTSHGIIEKLMGEKYNGVLSQSYGGKVTFKMDGLNEEQATKFVALAKELGLIK